MISEKCLREAIDARGIKHGWIADQAGISIQTMSNFMTGRQDMNADIFFEICKIIKFNKISVYKSGALVAQAVDSTALHSGTWDVIDGTFTSFENLDAPSPTGTNMQINIAGAWKPVESAQINVGGTWKSAASGSKIQVDGVWKTIF